MSTEAPYTRKDSTTTAGSQTLADAALAYAEAGLAVFPVWGIDDRGKCLCGGLDSCGEDGRNAGKHPMTPNGLKDATDKATVARLRWDRWPDANIGMATGAASGIVVLDVDGPLGRESLKGRELPDTITVTSGRENGGTHYWFRHPGYPVANSVGKIGLGLDVRGDGGYVILPPSRHESGKLYQWGDPAECDLDRLAELPEWLATAIAESAKRDKPGFTPTIRDGERNDTLFREGCGLRNKGASEGAILAYLTGRNLDCETPLGDNELTTIAHSAATYDPSPELATFRLTDVANGKRLIHLYGADLRYSYAGKQWFRWDNRRWAADDTGRVETLAKRTLTETVDLAERTGNLLLGEWARTSEKYAHPRMMVQHAQSEDGIPVTPDDLDTDPWLFNVENGTIDLRTGELLTHNRNDLITRMAPVAYDPSAECPRWKRFLAEIMPTIPATPGDPDDPSDPGDPGRSPEEAKAIIGYLQRLTGYGLTGSVEEQSLTFLYGTGKNGKSTFVETVAALMGDYWLKTPTETLMDKRGSAIPNDVARLKGARTVVANEVNQGGKMDEAKVKDLTGNDRITARFMRGEWFDFSPTFTLIMYGNHKPIINGTDEGIWRRVHLVPFTYTVPEYRRELDLQTTLTSELPGILNWAVKGALDWQGKGTEPKRKGLNPPESIVAATKQYREEMDLTGRFLEACCQRGADRVREDTADLYRAYQGWTDENGGHPKSSQNFGEELTKHGVGKKKSNNVNWRLGVKLTEEGWSYAQRQPPVGVRGN